MDRFYKSAKYITYFFTGLIIILLLQFQSVYIGAWNNQFYYNFSGNELEHIGYHLRYDIPYLICLFLLGLLYVILLKKSQKGSKVKRLSTLAIVGISILFVRLIGIYIYFCTANDIAYYTDNDLSDEFFYDGFFYYSWIFGVFIFSFAILLFARLYPRKSMAHIGGLLYFIFTYLYGIFILIYHFWDVYLLKNIWVNIIIFAIGKIFLVVHLWSLTIKKQ